MQTHETKDNADIRLSVLLATWRPRRRRLYAGACATGAVRAGKPNKVLPRRRKAGAYNKKRINAVATASSPATAYKPDEVLPVTSLSQPTANGAAQPER